MNTDDPKFTAHILGELDELTAAERTEIEALIRADPTAAAEAAETQALAALLRRELQGEEGQPLTPAQRATVLAATAPGARVEGAKVIPFPRRLTVLSAIAACLIVSVSIALIIRAFDAEKARLGVTAMNETHPGPTITLAPEPEQPAKLPLVVPEVADAAKAEAKPSDDLLAESQARIAHQLAASPAPMQTLASATAKPAPPASPPPAITDAELKIAASAQPEGATLARAGKPAEPVTGPGGLGAAVREQSGRTAGSGSTKSAKKGQLSHFDADRSDALRDYRRRNEEISSEKPRAIRDPSDPAITEAFDAITDNAFLPVRENPLSTFSIDVDTASYAIVRRFLNERQLPPKGAVRIEELLNYFTYDYPQPQGDAPFSATMEAATCPWTPAHRLVRIGLKGRENAKDKLATIAKDVKIQVEFNPAQVSGYRLIGYEKRLLAKEDFNHDKKDAREIGAGHTVTALYEVVPAGKALPAPAKVDALKYQTPAAEKPETSRETLTLKLRYKAPGGDTAKLLEFPLTDAGATWEKSSRDFRFAAAVAGYGMILRDSPHKGAATWSSVRKLAVEGKGADATGYRAEFITLLEKAQALNR